MRRLRDKQVLSAVVFLLLLGGGATVFVIQTRDTGGVLGVALGVAFVCYVGAFMFLLRWRDLRRADGYRPEPVRVQVRDEEVGTIYGLVAGRKYRVVRRFTDFYGTVFEENEVLEFRGRHFLPYHGGHTITFDGKPLFLQEDQNRDILDNFASYIVEE